ncbi:hypothetical protein MMC14_008132 [Varicellaria rhodocarpa]|nr:hypothetical protein [Varicellaria rhodocarpa]
MPPIGGVGDFISARNLLKQQSNPQAASRSSTPPSKAPFKPETHEQMANFSSNERRRLIAENARVEIPSAKVAHSDIRVPPIKPKRQNEIVPSSSPMSNTDVMHEDAQNHFYDTDVGNLDDTSTLSNGLQPEQSQTDENGHEIAESHFHRKWDNQGTKALDTHLSQDQDLLYDQGYQDEEYHIEAFDEDKEETDEDASSSEGYPAEDEPTMDSVKLNSAIRNGLVHPSEAGVFTKFVNNGLPFSPLTRGRLPIENQAFQLNGTTTPYPSTRSSETSLIPFPSAVGIFQNQQGPSQTLEYQNQNPSKISHHTPKKQHDNLSSQRHEMPRRKHKRQQDSTNRRNSQTQERDTSQPILPERLPNIASTALSDPQTQEPPPHNPSSPEEIADDPRAPPINMPSNNPETQMPISSSKHPLELDYLPSDLSKLPYSTLQSQLFEMDPHRPPPQLPSHLSTAPLPEKLSYMSSLPSNNRHHPQNPSTPNLTTFLSSLPMDQYEECGDLIIEQFSTILNKFKDVRRRKREVARAFEEEIASREAEVRETREGVENEVGRLGSGVREVVMRRR